MKTSSGCCSIQKFVGYLTRFYLLYDTVMEFFEEILKDKETIEKLIILKTTWHIFQTYSSC